MKAMLWKELRENFKWALLAMIGLCLAEIYGLNYYDPLNYNNRGLTLCNPTFLMATSFGCAIVGLLLGFLQILPEQRRDQWAALLHRPVSRDTIFRGKVVAGLGLYLVATVVPFLICVWLAATPGHFLAPFVPSMVLPGVADIGTGMVYYFAALLVALHRSSWFGARTLALFAAVYLSFFVTSASYFSPALAAAVLMALVLFTAAWGAMRSNGPFHVRPWLAKVALLAAVFYGLCGLGQVAHMLLKSNQQEDYTGSQYRITSDGQPVITTVNKDLTSKVTDLAGNIINDERYTGPRSYENFLFLNEVCYLIGDSHGYDPVSLYYQYRQSERHVAEVQINSFIPLPVSWFYLQEKKYFVGISRLNKQPVGIADTAGFKPAQAPEPFANLDGFAETYGTPCLVRNGDTVLAFDFEHEQMFQLPSVDEGKVYGAQLISFRNKDSSGYDQVIALAFAHELRIYDPKGNPLATLSYHHDDTDHYGTIELGVLGNQAGYLVEYEPSAWIGWGERNRMTSYLEEVDARGNVLHSYDLPPLPFEMTPRSWIDYIFDSTRSPALWFGNLAYQKVGGQMGDKNLADKDEAAFHEGWENTKEIATRLILYSLFFAVIALVWSRRMNFSWGRAWAWAGFVLAFNLAGLITFRLVADWPVRVRCPQCSQKRPVEEERCPHCGAGWPAPASRGTEILDKKEEVAAV